MQIDVGQRVFVAVAFIGERHMIEIDAAVLYIHDRILRIFQIRSLVQHLSDSADAGQRHTDHDDYHRQHHQAHQNAHDVTEQARQNTPVLMLPSTMKCAPSQDTEIIQKYTASIMAGLISASLLSALTKRRYRLKDAFEELFILIVFSDKRLDHTDALKRFPVRWRSDHHICGKPD